MLSKVAERVYWAARYIERVESTARLVNIYAVSYTHLTLPTTPYV